MRSERTAESSVNLVAPIVKVWMEAQQSIPALDLHELLRESLSLYSQKTHCLYVTRIVYLMVYGSVSQPS